MGLSFGNYAKKLTGFEKNWLPHTQIKLMILPEMDCWFNKLHESGFCRSLSQTLCKPRVVLWRYWLVITILYWCSGPQRTGKFQFGMFWACKGGPVKAQFGPHFFSIIHQKVIIYYYYLNYHISKCNSLSNPFTNSGKETCSFISKSWKFMLC